MHWINYWMALRPLLFLDLPPHTLAYLFPIATELHRGVDSLGLRFDPIKVTI